MDTIDKPKLIFKIEKALGKRVLWSKEHDTYLLQLVTLNNGKNWKRIASGMQMAFNNEGLTAKKCRERWSNCTDPTVDKSCLSKSEELMLLACHYKYGNKWAQIAQHLPTRNSSKVKNTFSSLIKKVCRKIALGIYEETTTPLIFIQEFYMALTVYDLIDLKDNPKHVGRIASEHISKHIESKNVTTEQCLEYAKRLSEVLISCYKDTFADFSVMTDLIVMKSFINKLFKLIMVRYSSNSLEADLSILKVIGSALLDDLTLNNSQCFISEDILSKNISVIPTNLDSEEPNEVEFIEEPVFEELALEPAFLSSPTLQVLMQPKYSLEDLPSCFETGSPTYKKAEASRFMTSLQPDIGEMQMGVFSYIQE